jgi:CelD/BcsL family acetyltransferase involved in cellulose biosynthesis
MNFFSNESFLEAFGQVYFPEQTTSSQVFELAGRLWKLPTHNGQPISGAPFIDFFEPLDEPSSKSHTGTRSVRYLLRANQGIVPCTQWFEQQLEQQFDPSPTLLWHSFDHWDAFTQYAKRKESRIFSDARRRQRKLEKEVGTIQYHWNNPQLDVLETCFRWKSEQLRRQELPDPFANKSHQQFLQELVTRQLLLVSSLTAGDRVLAVHIGMVDQGRFYSWVTTYDSTYSQYAPGRLLLHFLLEESFQQQHTEFDFLWGGEDYKWHYATHVRLITDLGTRPLPRQLNHLIKNALRSFPQVADSVKQLRNKVLRSTVGSVQL